MKTLETYLKRKHITLTGFAELADISRTHLYRIIKDGYTPSLKVILRIETLTDGEISLQSWIPKAKFINKKKEKRRCYHDNPR